MRTMLINPHDASQGGFSNPPLNLAYLAGTLEFNNLEVKIADGYLIGFEGILKEVDVFNPDIVGITCYTPGRTNALKIAKFIKKKYPNALIVLGGAHPTILWKQILTVYSYVDICVIGEGEQTFLEIAQGKNFEEIAGIAWRKNGQVICNTERPYFENLDEIPFPAWHLLELEKYPSVGSYEINGINLASVPRIPVVFSRGCTANCSFCSTWWIWRGHRCRSGKNMTDELELLNKKFGVKHFVFEDDAFSANINAAKNLCKEIINRKLNIVWFATTRVDAVDTDLLELMKQAGCYGVSYGVETGSQRLLDVMGKEATVQQAMKTMIATKQAGLQTTALLIVGNRGETKETINETVEFLNNAKPNSVGTVGGLWIFPGTSLYQHAKKEGIIDDSFWLSDKPVQVYLAEHTKEELRKYLFAIASRKKMDSFSFKFLYFFWRIRWILSKISLINAIYRMVRPRRY